MTQPAPILGSMRFGSWGAKLSPAGVATLLEGALDAGIDTLDLADIYGDQQILMDGIVPRDLVLGAPSYRREMQHIYVPHKSYANVCGSDLIRCQDGQYRWFLSRGKVLRDATGIPVRSRSGSW